MAKDSKVQKLEYRYKFNEDYNPKYANGCIGGFNDNGEITLNFYMDRNPVPRVQKLTLDLNKSPNVVSEFAPSNIEEIKVRFIQTGVTLNYQSAKNLREWLDNNIKKFEDVVRQNTGKNG